MSKISKIILTILIFGLLFSLPIISVNVVPEVTVRVLDVDRIPMADIKIFQDWQHWTFESKQHREEKVSNVDGYVTFTEKSIRVSVFSLLLGRLSETISNINIHAGSGPSSIFGAKDYVADGYWCYENCLEDKPKEVIIKEKLR